jgi:HAMP domain-containing protein
MDGVIMASNKKWLYIAIGVIIGLILFSVNAWLAIAVIVLAIAVPTGAYMMLDPSQRRRYREIRRRNQLGR